MNIKARRPLSKSEWLLFLAPLMILAGLGLYTALRPLFPRTLSGHVDPIKSLEFSPDGSKLLVISAIPIRTSRQVEKNRKITVWDVSSQFKLWERLDPTRDPEFTSDGKLIATEEWKPSFHISLADSQTGQAVKRIQGAREYRRANQHLAFTQEHFATLRGSARGHVQLIKIWDDNSGSFVQSFTRDAFSEGGELFSGGEKMDFGVSPDNQTFAMFEGEKRIKLPKHVSYYQTHPTLWNIQSGKRLQMLPARAWTALQVINESTILLGELKKENARYLSPYSLQLWNWQAGRHLKTLEDKASRWCFSNDKKQIMILKDLSYVETKEPFQGHIIGNGGEFSLFSLPNGKLRWKVQTENDVSRIYVDDKITFLLSQEWYNSDKVKDIYDRNRWAVLRDGRSGKILAEYSGIRACAISPDGNTLATGDEKGNVRLYDTRRFLN